jgi:hypothetical protein
MSNLRRQRLPRDEEEALKAYRRSVIMALLDMDTLYTRKGEWLSQYAVARMLDITIVAAAYCMTKMKDDRILISLKKQSGSYGIERLYKKKPVSVLSTCWRKHPNYHPMPSRYQLGAPI